MTALRLTGRRPPASCRSFRGVFPRRGVDALSSIRTAVLERAALEKIGKRQGCAGATNAGCAVRTRRRALPRIGLQPGRLDAGDRARLVIVGGVAGDADGAEQPLAILDQHAAG